MAKRKNHTSKNQNRKDHRGGIKLKGKHDTQGLRGLHTLYRQQRYNALRSNDVMWHRMTPATREAFNKKTEERMANYEKYIKPYSRKGLHESKKANQ